MLIYIYIYIDGVPLQGSLTLILHPAVREGCVNTMTLFDLEDAKKHTPDSG